MENQIASSITCDCRPPRPNFFGRYRDFLLTRDTMLTLANILTLLIAFIVSLLGYKEQAGKWIYLLSALIGGTPLFIFTAKQVFVKHDFTAGVMATIATIAAIIVGEYEAAAVVVMMMSVGEWLENFTIARADNALRDLAKLIPATVTVRRDGHEALVPLDQVNPGDIVLVRTGERIGVDGTVTAGCGSVNQSAITGESMPVEKNVGDEVFAGACNDVGTLEVCVERVGAETTLGHIVRMVKEAQASQAPVQRVANQYARILVPVTIVISVLVYFLTGDVLRSITVLVAVCPCALVLATPTAVVAAIGNAAKHGMLVKNGGVMEQVGKLDVVAFDKTGTLTLGKPAVKEVISLNGLQADRLLELAATAERFSEHAIGRAMVQACKERHLALGEPLDFTVLPGYGVTARVGKSEVVIGSRALLAERGLTWMESVEGRVRELEGYGQTVIPVIVDGSLAGLITLVDTPRPQAKEAIAELKRLGVKEVIMITGDNPRAAGLIAREMGIDRVYAEVLPQDKLNIVRELQEKGKRKVAFVGDGVNDAPALAAADIGIAMGVAGTDVAMETADIGLMADELERLPQVMGLSRRTLKVINQNVVFSMSVNLLSVILGSAGLITPVIGAIIHEFSSVPVLANSARMVDHRLISGSKL